MELQLDNRFQKKVKGMFGKYSFEVGVLEDGPYRMARKGARGFKGTDVLSTYAGGPVRKKSGVNSGLTISEVSEKNRERLGFNYLKKPFENRNSDIIQFAQSYFGLVFGRVSIKRCENLLQAIVRNPILRGEYGTQSKVTTLIKGFYRPMIDTAQLFRAIKAKCKVVGHV